MSFKCITAELPMASWTQVSKRLVQKIAKSVNR